MPTIRGGWIAYRGLGMYDIIDQMEYRGLHEDFLAL